MDILFLHSPAIGNLVSTIINSWIGPAFVGLIAVVALILLFKRQFAGFITFAAMAILAAIFIFFGGDLFGKGGNLSNSGKELAKKINVVDLTSTTASPEFLKVSS